MNNIVNRALGFKPYNIGNQTGWVKEVIANKGSKHLYKKLPSGTTLEMAVNKHGFVLRKKILKNNGTEIKSYWSNSKGGRRIYVRKPDGHGLTAETRLYNFETDKYERKDIYNRFYSPKKFFNFITVLKMKLGL